MQFQNIFTVKKVGIGALALLVLTTLALLTLLRMSIPATPGELVLEGKAGAITIHFDEIARPYVQAKTMHDALYAEGWLHGSHRLWQMELFRRAAQGQLSELLGSGMLETDKEMWRIGVPQLARQLHEDSSQEMNSSVDAYVNGINKAIADARVRPPEFLLTGTKPAPWTSSDVYAMGALMAFQSANNFPRELLRMALTSALEDEFGPDIGNTFQPTDARNPGFPFVTQDHSKISKTMTSLAAANASEVNLLPSFAFGSNGWAVAPERSKSGKALFAFDSHDSLGLPNLFYEVHLFFDRGSEIRGWSVAGLPGVINGYNERIAWGFTNIGDTQDLFIETRSKDNPLLFKSGDEWVRGRQERVAISVRGASEPAELTITFSHNGPLISEDPPIALKWTAHNLEGRGLDAVLDFNRAQNWEEFTKALSRFPAPTLNATYADIDGHIGFKTAGLVPVRGQGEGLYPLDGSKPENQWQGTVPDAELPVLFDPPSGYVAAANARVNAPGNGPLISADNAPGYRIRRIQSVLSKRSDFTLDDMQNLQMDWHDGQAALLLPTLLADLDRSALSNIELIALKELENWDLIANADDAAALLYQVWYRALIIELFEPQLTPELFNQFFRDNYLINQTVDSLVLNEKAHKLWRGKRAGILSAALASAVEEISSVQGKNINKWKLENQHRVLLRHELGKAVPMLGRFFHAKPAPWGGSVNSIGRARYTYAKGLDVTTGATVRVVGEMDAPPTMKAVMPGGQSGHPMSQNYSDQFESWLEGHLVPIAETPENVPAVER